MFVAIVSVMFFVLTAAFVGRIGAFAIGQSGRNFVHDYQYVIVLVFFAGLNIWLWA